MKNKLIIQKHSIGSLLVWSSALLPLLLWLFTESAEPRGHRFFSGTNLINAGQLAGLVGMAMLSIAFVLSSRARFLEDYFGGLDKMYRLHHRLGQTAFVLLLIHPIAHALRFVPDRIGSALLFLLPTHEKLAVDLGSYAFWSLLLLMTLTLFVKIPYDKWKLSHKFLGLVLIIGTIHMLTVESTRGRPVAVMENPILRYYMLGLAALGVVCFCYKIIVLPLFSRRHMYTVQAVRRLSDEVLQIELAPQRRRVAFVPGQFVFVTFDQEGLSHESHPFTICTVPEHKDIVLTIKALGDFTEALYRRLQSGASVKVEGPYGRFNYRVGSPQQIWIAAGVGVTPFLSWARHMEQAQDSTYQARFYYCVHSRNDAVQYQEFERIAARQANLQVTLVCSEEQGHLRAADIGNLDDKEIFMCGPKRFTTGLQRQFRELGVAGDRIHFEDFEFR
jgi:predicted ferric reductase